MFNCSLYFPQIHVFTQPPSVFLKCESVDEESLIAEAEAVLDRNEALIKANAIEQFQSSPGNRTAFFSRTSAESQRHHSHIQSLHGNSYVANSSTSSSPSSSSLSEIDTGYADTASTQRAVVIPSGGVVVRPLPPVKKPWSFVKKAFVTFLTASGTFVIYKFVVKPPSYEGPEVDLRGKTIIVAEATSRMSRNLLRELAERKATLVLTSRSMDDCEDTRNRLIRSVAGAEEVRIDCRPLELESSRSIRRFAGAIMRDYPNGIDRLLLQPPGLLSGVIAGERRCTHDAFEHQLGTSFFSFYLLTRLLLPAMSGKDRDARVIFAVDTRAAGFAEAIAEKDPNTGAVRLPLDNWNWNEGYSPSAAYQRAHWALYLFADALAKRTAETGPSVMIADPSVNRTSPPSQLSGEAQLIAPLRWLRNVVRSYLNLGHLITRVAPQRVTATELMCTIATKEGLGLSGVLTTEVPVFQKLERKETQNAAERSEAQELLWRLGEKWTHLDTHPEPVPLPPRT